MAKRIMTKTSTTQARRPQTAREAMAASSASKGFTPAIMRSVAALSVLDAWQEGEENYGYFTLHQHDGEIDEIPPQDLHYLVPRDVEFRPDVLITERSSRSLKDDPSAPIVPYRRNRAPNWVRRYCYRFPPRLGGWIIMAKSNVVLVYSVLNVYADYAEMAGSTPGLAARDRKALLLEIAGRLAAKTEGVTIRPPVTTQQN